MLYHKKEKGERSGQKFKEKYIASSELARTYINMNGRTGCEIIRDQSDCIKFIYQTGPREFGIRRIAEISREYSIS